MNSSLHCYQHADPCSVIEFLSFVPHFPRGGGRKAARVEADAEPWLVVGEPGPASGTVGEGAWTSQRSPNLYLQKRSHLSGL